MTSTLAEAEAFFDGMPLGVTAVRWVASTLDHLGAVDIAVSRSQVAFGRPDAGGRAHRVAYLWRPGQYLSHPHAPVVLSVSLDAEDHSPRWKQVVHPAPTTWMHHLELTTEADLDDEVASWLTEAYLRSPPTVQT